MQKIDYAAALVVIGCAFATPAVGQDDCLASFKANPSQSLTYVSIGPNADDRIETTMSCSVAGELRDQVYLTGKTIDPNVLSDINELRSKVLEIKARLDDGKSKLDRATTEPARFSAVLNLKDAALAAGVASATTGCIVSAEACKPAVRASVVLYELATSASKVGNLPQARTSSEGDQHIDFNASINPGSTK
jgi:hypothetical protein